MKFIKTFWRTFILIIVILILSLANMNNVMPKEMNSFKHIDKVAHLCMYLSLSFMFFIENYSVNNYFKRRWIILDTILFGIGIEFFQTFFTNDRTGDFYDAIFNSIGVLFGAFLFLMLRNYKFIYKLLFIPIPYKI